MDLKKSKYILPNLFTLASVFLGVLAVVSCLDRSDEGFRRAAIAILLAMVADSLDGRVARMTRTATKFGIQLDSLADVLSFGMAPALVAYLFALHAIPVWDGLLGVLVAFVYTACGALRLARFNLQAEASKKPTTTFTGLPIPAAAGAVATLVWASADLGFPIEVRLATLIPTMLVVALLMVSTILYPSFKHVRLGLAARAALLVGLAGVIVAAWKTQASAVLLALAGIFVLMGPAGWIVGLPFRLRALRRRTRAPVDRDAPSP